MTNKYEDIMRQCDVRFRSQNTEANPSPATDEELAELEAELGYSLPDDYREFLRYYGGCTLHASYPVWKDGREDGECFEIVHGRVGMASDYHSLVREYDNESAAECYPGLSLIRGEKSTTEENWPPELLPIGNNCGTREICLALFGLRPGAIFLWHSLPSDRHQNVYLIADSFDEFMHLLSKYE